MFLKSLLHILLQRIKNEQGVFIVLTALMIPVIFGFAGLAYDVGNLYVQKGKLQNIADSAALAGAATYRDIATNKTTSNQISADDSFDNNTYSTTRPSDAAFSTSNHGNADKLAWDYIEKNKGDRLISVNGPFALNGKVSVSTPAGTAYTDADKGVYYRVRLSEEIPVHFLSLIPGIENHQTVNAEAIVALSTDTGTQAYTEQEITTQYIRVFDNLFTYWGDLKGDTLSNINNGSQENTKPLQKVINKENVELYAYMLYMNRQYSGVIDNWTKSSIENYNQNYYKDAYNNYFYDDMDSFYSHYYYYKQRRFVNLKLSNAGNFTVKINYPLGVYDSNLKQYNRDAYYYDYNNGARTYYAYTKNTSNGQNKNKLGYWEHLSSSSLSSLGPGNEAMRKTGSTDSYNFSNTHYLTNADQGFPLPLYLFKDNGYNTTIDVTNNPIQITRENKTIDNPSYPIVLYHYNQFSENETTVTININTGQVFRGVIMAPRSHVIINNNGKFVGTVAAKNVTASQGIYEHKNFFQNEDEDFADWYYNYLGLGYVDDGHGNKIPNVPFVQDTESESGIMVPDSNHTQWADFLNQLKTNTALITYYDAEGKDKGSRTTSFYNSLYYNEYGLNLQKYPFGSQEWFESLNLQQKARVAYFWEYIYKDNTGLGKIQWLWARPATRMVPHVYEGKDAMRSLRLINSRMEDKDYNPFYSSTDET